MVAGVHTDGCGEVLRRLRELARAEGGIALGLWEYRVGARWGECAAVEGGAADAAREAPQHERRQEAAPEAAAGGRPSGRRPWRPLQRDRWRSVIAGCAARCVPALDSARSLENSHVPRPLHLQLVGRHCRKLQGLVQCSGLRSGRPLRRQSASWPAHSRDSTQGTAAGLNETTPHCMHSRDLALCHRAGTGSSGARRRRGCTATGSYRRPRQAAKGQQVSRKQ